MTVCCQNLTLGALGSRSALSMLVGALFKKFGFFLNTPLIVFITKIVILTVSLVKHLIKHAFKQTSVN